MIGSEISIGQKVRIDLGDEHCDEVGLVEAVSDHRRVRYTVAFPSGEEKQYLAEELVCVKE